MHYRLLLSPIVIRAFRRVQAPGAAVCLFLGILLLLLIIRDAVMWHVVPLIVITVLMAFSSFGYYGQIWINRAYTYECAIEEMPAGYGDGECSQNPSDWRRDDALYMAVLVHKRGPLGGIFFYPKVMQERVIEKGLMTGG